MNDGSALYVGSVMHRRLAPRAHAFRYRCFWLLLDLDDLASLSGRLRLFSHGRRNLFALHDCDHGDGSDEPLRRQIDRLLDRHGMQLSGPVRLLCMPRTLGYSFNPLSLYFCHRDDGELGAIIHQVHNTFGARHAYVLPIGGAGPIAQDCPKTFSVSPFLDMDMHYDFRVTPPGQRVAVTIRARRGAETLLTASLVGERRNLSDRELLRAFGAMPAVTLKVMAAIHWEALRLWCKGLRLRPQHLSAAAQDASPTP